MVSETWESFVKLPHDATLTMEQVSITSSHTLALAPCWGRFDQKARLVSKSGSDGARDLGKLCKAAS